MSKASPAKSVTSPRPTMIVLKKEGDRTIIPEGGEMVCCKSYDNNKLYMKIEYSREIMMRFSKSVLSAQRPANFAEIMEDNPEICASPVEHPYIPNNFISSPCRVGILSQPLAGPITEVDKIVAAVHINHIMQPKYQEPGVTYSPSGFPLRKLRARSNSPGISSTSLTEIRMPRFV